MLAFLYATDYFMEQLFINELLLDIYLKVSEASVIILKSLATTNLKKKLYIK